MKIFALPPIVRGIVFDIDNTLYQHKEYVELQTDLLLRRLARERGESYETTRSLVEQYRAEAAASSGGRRPSLGNSFLQFGIPIETSVRWREEELRPERYLSADPELARLLEELSAHYRLCCVTNNPQSVGRRTLRALAIDRFLPVVVGLDDCGVSKPSELPFRRAAELVELPPEQMVSIGDRFEVDLEPALAAGMGAILVEGRDDLFQLPLRRG
ncbi:HAD family hydrolase [Salinispira pacifica]